MTISLITVCFNCAATIRTALESVLRQTWRDIEYLVIDGGSTDGTVDVIRKYEREFKGRMRWVSEKDRGMYDAINKGIRMATGDVVGILNADDVLAADDVIERVKEVYGSLTHGAFSDSSDLDIRFVSKPGFWNGIRTCNRVTEERLRAFLLGFPLDIYMFRDSAETSRKMNTLKERPIFVYSDRDGVRLTFREAVASNQREVPA